MIECGVDEHTCNHDWVIEGCSFNLDEAECKNCGLGWMSCQLDREWAKREIEMTMRIKHGRVRS